LGEGFRVRATKVRCSQASPVALNYPTNVLKFKISDFKIAFCAVNNYDERSRFAQNYQPHSWVNLKSG
jgi:hypothetical protein